MYIYRLILVAYNFCFSAKVEHKKGRKEKVEKRSFVLSAQLHGLSFFKNLKEVDKIFFLSKCHS